MNAKRARLILLFVILVVFYLGRSVLGAFFLAAVFAYLLSPVVQFLHRRFRLPKGLAALVVFLIFLVFLGEISYLLVSRLFSEVEEFRARSLFFLAEARRQLINYPAWLQSLVYDSLASLENIPAALPGRILPFFTGAVSRFINLLIFLTAAFYFLKDGHELWAGGRRILEESTSEKMSQVLSRVSATLSRYLRGQLFLISLMSTVTFLALSFLNVKFALLLGIFTGFAEIVPIVGPIFATVLTASVAAVDGQPMFTLDPVAQAGVVVLVYFIFRQLEDIVVIPSVMGRIAGVHPVVVMFAVILGGHLAGTWGLFLAVPVLAALKIIFEVYW